MSLPTVYAHPSPRLTLLPHLLPLLPYTLPLVRRLQFHLQSPHAHVLSTLAPDHPPSPPSAPSPPFAALYLDRSRAPETECWLFSTLELPPSAPHPDADPLPHLLALLAHVPRLPLPAAYPATQPPSRLLLGAVHRSVLQTLAGAPIAPAAGKTVISGPGAPAASPEEESPHGCVRDHTVAYQKFLFRPGTIARAAGGEEEEEEEEGDRAGQAVVEGLGLAWTTVRAGEFALVASRTEIPRTGRTMRLLGSVGLRRGEGGGDGRLVAWAFLGPDGSLTSLHVEPEWRGRGLGKLVTRRLFGLLGRGEGEAGFEGVGEGEEWCHSDVATDNAGSIGVARGLGGEEGWECFWGWVDLEEAERMSGGGRGRVGGMGMSGDGRDGPSIGSR
ncbi:hypothetical protein MMC15_001925 [Xylographa vitiligo]|nr:hypothetical protein [Xylographa vitiligo]